jgi:hypothetical protein
MRFRTPQPTRFQDRMGRREGLVAGRVQRGVWRSKYSVSTAGDVRVNSLFLHQRGKSIKRHLPVWNLIGSYLTRVGCCWILLCRKRTPQIYRSITCTAARSAMRSGSGFVRQLGKSLLGSLHSCNYWSIDLPNSMVRQHPRSYPLSRICFRGENFIPQGYDGHRVRRISRDQIAATSSR